MMETLDIWMLPCANPDGREYVMNHDELWRKNRRDNPDTPCDGVDVNRNLDIVWGVTVGHTSCSPCAGEFVGAAAFSEPESQNVKYLCDTYRIDVFLDVHSYSELVLYPWGHAPTQSTNPSQRFTNLATGTCLPLNPADHQENMPPRDQLRFQTVARRIVDDIRAVRGRNYKPGTIFNTVYANTGTTGTSSDYVYSRHIANAALHKTHGFAFETGPFDENLANSFHPADPAKQTAIKRDTKAGILSLLQQSICTIELIGAMLLSRSTDVQAFRDVRDELLATSQGGRRWISLFERVQSPVLDAVLADESLTPEAISLLERAQKLLENEEAIVSMRDVERGLAFWTYSSNASHWRISGATLPPFESSSRRRTARGCARSSTTSSDLDAARLGPDESLGP